ncbi:MAG: hypothetical protein ACI8U0_001706, partial [Flavobacteriales bacterium]
RLNPQGILVYQTGESSSAAFAMLRNRFMKGAGNCIQFIFHL